MEQGFLGRNERELKEENELLSEQNDSRRRQIESLLKEVDRLSEDRRILREKNEFLETKNTAIEKEFNSVRELCLQHESLFGRKLELQNDQHRAHLADFGATVEAMLEEKKREMTDVQEELRKAQLALHQRESDWKKESEMLQKNVKAGSERLQETLFAFEQVTENYDQIKEKHEKVNSQLAETRSEKSGCEALIVELQKQVRRGETTIDSLELKLRDRDEQLEEKTQKIKFLGEKIEVFEKARRLDANLEAELAASKEEVYQAELNEQHLKKTLSELENALSHAGDRNKKLDDWLRSMRESEMLAKQKRIDLQDALAEAREKLAIEIKARKLAEDLFEDAKHYKLEKVKVDQRCTELEYEAQVAKKDMETQVETNRELESELEETRKKVLSQEAQLATGQRDLLARDKIINEMRLRDAQYSILQDKLHKVEDEKRTLLSELTDLEDRMSQSIREKVSMGNRIKEFEIKETKWEKSLKDVAALQRENDELRATHNIELREMFHKGRKAEREAIIVEQIENRHTGTITRFVDGGRLFRNENNESAFRGRVQSAQVFKTTSVDTVVDRNNADTMLSGDDRMAHSMGDDLNNFHNPVVNGGTGLNSGLANSSSRHRLLGGTELGAAKSVFSDSINQTMNHSGMNYGLTHKYDFNSDYNSRSAGTADRNHLAELREQQLFASRMLRKF